MKYYKNTTELNEEEDFTSIQYVRNTIENQNKFYPRK